MAGRLTALTVLSAASTHLIAMLEAGPQLAGALSSLSFSFDIGSGLSRFHTATATILALSAGLQHVNLGLGSTGQYEHENYSTIEVQLYDAAFQQLMRSLPCCQSLRLGYCCAVSRQAMGRELLRRAPDLVSLDLHTGQCTQQVSTSDQVAPQNLKLSPHTSDCRLADRCQSSAHTQSLLLVGISRQIVHAQGEYVFTTVQELSSLTRLTKLRVDTTDYQTADGSLQGLSALHLLRDLEVAALQPATDTRLATVLLLSYCTALTRLGNLYVPTEVHTRRCIGASVLSLLVSGLQGVAQ